MIELYPGGKELKITQKQLKFKIIKLESQKELTDQDKKQLKSIKAMSEEARKQMNLALLKGQELAMINRIK